MRHTITLGSALALLALGCSQSHGPGSPDAGLPCGPDRCGAGEFCCMACGGAYCAPEGGACGCIEDGGAPARCGTRGAPDCPAGTFCELSIACGRDDSGGECVPVPAACDGTGSPVCGCDGRTYDEPCAARRAGMSVDHGGPCDPSACAPQDARVSDPACDTAAVYWMGSQCVELRGCCAGGDCGAGYATVDECLRAHLACDRGCGGWLGPTCRSDEFCDFAADGCDWADASGVCRPRPASCPPGGTPQCGCDGMDYPSVCEAQRAGVDSAGAGGCIVPG